MNRTDEQRLRRIEEMLEEIHARLIIGTEKAPGQEEYRLAIAELMKGNTKPLSLFKRRGGVIPKVDDDRSGTARGQRERPGTVPGKPAAGRGSGHAPGVL